MLASIVSFFFGFIFGHIFFIVHTFFFSFKIKITRERVSNRMSSSYFWPVFKLNCRTFFYSIDYYFFGFGEEHQNSTTFSGTVVVYVYKIGDNV